MQDRGERMNKFSKTKKMKPIILRIKHIGYHEALGVHYMTMNHHDDNNPYYDWEWTEADTLKLFSKNGFDSTF